MKRRKGRPVGISKFPLAEMNVGDSFFYTASSIGGFLAAKRKFVAEKPGVNFTTRKRVENGKSGIRVWRVR